MQPPAVSVGLWCVSCILNATGETSVTVFDDEAEARHLAGYLRWYRAELVFFWEM